MSNPADSVPSALAGVRVLDLSRVLAGPWATQILGDLGAEVVKVEKPGDGDDTRSWGPPFVAGADGGRGDASYYLAANRNKRSVTIDFSKSDGADLVKRMIPRCQILVENFKVGGLAQYGLDYGSVRELNPALVYCSISGFGQDGPYAQRPGYDFMIQAMGGLMSLTGEPAGEPMKSAVAVADLFTGMYASTAILAALRHAERTGEGQHVDVSLLDCQVAMLANLGANYLTSHQTPQRFGNAHVNIAPYQVFPTSDGHIVIAVGNDGQFRAFCAEAGLTLADDPRFATNAGRTTNRIELADAIGVVMTQRPTAHWIAVLERAKVPCGPINTLPEVFADPHVAARHMVEDMTRSDGAKIRLVASPIKMERTPPRTRVPPPLLGRDTDAVLEALAGVAAEERERLRAAHVI